MSELSKDFLHHILKTVPEAQRLEFLKEVMATLPSEAIEQLLQGVNDAASAETPSPWESIEAPWDAEPIAPIPEISEPVENTERPTASPSPQPIPEEPPAKQRKVDVDSEFQRIMSMHNAESGDNMKKQMVSCVVYALVGVVLLAMISVGGAKLWDWIKSLI